MTRSTAELIEDIEKELPSRSDIHTIHAIVRDILDNLDSSGVGDLVPASDDDMFAGTEDGLVTTDLLISSSAFVALTDAATIDLDWATGFNFSLTIAGNRTLGNPTNGQPGTSRTIVVTQGASGNHTLAFDTQYKFENGVAATLSTSAADVDDLTIFCITDSLFHVFINTKMS